MTGPQLRRLPWVPSAWELGAEVVVVGSGAAGISAALAAAGHGRRVLLVSKTGTGATPLAQGGMAAAIGPGDAAWWHSQDTLLAGAGLCDPAAVSALVAGAPGEVARLTGLGARLDCAGLHREGGHSHSRIVHAGGDATGAEVDRALRAALDGSTVEVLPDAVALDLLTDTRGSAAGLLVGLADGQGGLRVGVVTGDAVVLATGGFGQAFATTTNPAGLTGDGLALAARAGAELRDIEFVQFHPTVLWQQASRGQCPLITEALRGAGAVLVDPAGRPVMAGRHPLADLAPRDVVSAAMQQVIGEGDAGHLWLDATGVGRGPLERDFPTVTALCRARGIDPATEPIPVAPGAHYACGGIRADMDGRTSVAGLFAIGEVASSGVHGANRLASNSLTESLIMGRRVGDLLGRERQERPGRPEPAWSRQPGPRIPAAEAGLTAEFSLTAEVSLAAGASPGSRDATARAMSRYAGVVRDRTGMRRLLGLLDQVPAGDGTLSLAAVEATSLHTVSVLVATAALARTESRGCHRWQDVPVTSAGPASHTVVRVDDGQLRIMSGTGVRT